VRSRARTLLVALTLATLATVLTAPPAHAAPLKSQTHLVSQFDSGHTGWVKIGLEGDANNAMRAHLGVWCQNASGTKVQCGAIDISGSLKIQYWREAYSSWVDTDIWEQIITLYSDPPLTLNRYTFWGCTGQGTDQYRAIIMSVRIQDAFGQWGGWKIRTHPTWNGTSC
jgi:hypothetical protein